MNRKHLAIGLCVAVALISFWIWLVSSPAPPTPEEQIAAAEDSATEAALHSGPDSLEHAKALDKLTTTLYTHGRGASDECLKAAESATEIKRSLGNEAELSSSYNNLASVLRLRGELSQALHLFERVAIYRRQHNPESKKLARSLNNLASLYRELGDYSKALPLFSEALDAAAKSQATTLEVSLNLNRGILLHEVGDLDEALRYLEKARAYWPDDAASEPKLANVLNSIARVHHDAKRHKLARESFDKSLKIWLSLKNRPFAAEASTINNLAFLFHDLGEIARAEPLYTEALSLRKRALGEKAPATLWTQSNLGLFALSHGRIERARIILRKNLADRREVLGENHVLTGHSHALAALVEGVDRRADLGFDSAIAAEKIRLQSLSLLVPNLSERQAVLSKKLRIHGLDMDALDVLLSILAESPENDVLAARVWDAVIRSRAFVLDESAKRARFLREAQDDASRSQLILLAKTRARLANLAIRDQPNPSLETELRDLKEKLEREVGRTRTEGSDRFADAQSGWREVRNTIRDQSVESGLIAFVRYRKLPLEAPLKASAAYCAFVCSPDGVASFHEIGSAKELDPMIERYRLAIQSAAFGDSSAESAVAKETWTSGQALRTKIWDPLQDALGDASFVAIVPDGLLHLLSFSALPTTSSTSAGKAYLVESGRVLHHLSAERDVVRTTERPASDPQRTASALLIGDPLFGSEGEDADGQGFAALPATKDEVGAIQEILQNATTLTRETATEGRVLQSIANKSVVHFATHGFFVQPDEQSLSTNSLLRSGIALSGANERTEKAPSDDGILTAAEIASLDLSQADWVVVSACGTGIGQVETGEGVFGLRRALEIAGARSSVLSLWAVEDRATQDWMRRLYRARFEQNLSTLEAARTATLETLSARRKNGDSTHPFYWAAFTAFGDWR